MTTNNEKQIYATTTTDKQKYINVWGYHIDQLKGLGIPLIGADAKLYEELNAIQDRLKELVVVAANQDFPESN
jgi:hypothetical protein